MSDNTGKGFDNQTNEEKLKTIHEMLDKFLSGVNDDEKAELMMDMMPKMMGNGMPMMKKMCQSMMGMNMFDQKKQESCKESSDSCCGESKESTFATPEIKTLFEDWVHQVQDEIDGFRKENASADMKEIAKNLKISEESLKYFLKDNTDVKSEVSQCGSSSGCDASDEDVKNADYEVVKIEKIKSTCPVCENYAKKHTEKPIVVMSCEGACLRGDVSRRAANLICHSLAPEKTVRLCLGGAFTKDSGQRDLVRNAERVIALEGCSSKCASRMMKGVVSDVEPEIIMTDRLFRFDTSLFGIDEMPEEDIKANSLEVAKKIVEKL